MEMSWGTFWTILAQGMITFVVLTLMSFVVSAIVSAVIDGHRRTTGGQKTITESKPPVVRRSSGERPTHFQ